jgi:hypothetical protein
MQCYWKRNALRFWTEIQIEMRWHMDGTATVWEVKWNVNTLKTMHRPSAAEDNIPETFVLLVVFLLCLTVTLRVTYNHFPGIEHVTVCMWCITTSHTLILSLADHTVYTLPPLVRYTLLVLISNHRCLEPQIHYLSNSAFSSFIALSLAQITDHLSLTQQHTYPAPSLFLL